MGPILEICQTHPWTTQNVCHSIHFVSAACNLYIVRLCVWVEKTCRLCQGKTYGFSKEPQPHDGVPACHCALDLLLTASVQHRSYISAQHSSCVLSVLDHLMNNPQESYTWCIHMYSLIILYQITSIIFCNDPNSSLICWDKGWFQKEIYIQILINTEKYYTFV